MSEFKAFCVRRSENQVCGQVEMTTLDQLSTVEKEREVVIAVEYSSVNYKDALAATGKGKLIRDFPRVGGIDAAGKVVSSADPRFSKGDPVIVTGYELGTGHDGGYADYIRVPADWVEVMPEGLTARTAMIYGTAGFTSGLSIRRLEQMGLAPEQGPVVITGASGGVGTMAITMFAKLGYEVVAVSGKPEEFDSLQALGANEVLNRNDLKLDGPPLEKGQWAAAIDNVGGDMLAWLTRTVKPWGGIASIGLAGGSQLNTTVMPFILRGVSLLGISSSNCPKEWRADVWQALAGRLMPDNLETMVTDELGLDDLTQVFDNMLQGKTKGRTLIKI